MKHKYMSVLLSGIISLLALPAINVLAAETVEPVLMNTEFQTSQDSDFTTSLYVPENSNISDFQAVLTYDTAYVTLIDAKEGANENGQVVINSEDEGVIYLSYTSTENQTEQINVVDLTFHVADDLAADSYNFIALDKTETNSASSISDSGTFIEYNMTSEFTDMNIYQYGDADLNGTVQSRDVTFLKQYIVKMRELSDVAKVYSNAYIDYEDDEVTPKINSRDALLIQQKIVKMDVNLGDRVTVTFYNADGTVYTKKSIKTGGSVTNIPEIPTVTGYSGGQWSATAEGFTDVSFENLSSDLEVYAVYDTVDDNVDIYEKTIEALELGFTQAGKYIVDDFQLPYKNNYGSFNMLSTEEFNGVDIIWSIDSGVLAQSVNIAENYVVDVPQLDYTTWVTFTANIYIDGVNYGSHEFPREIKGTIDIPDSSIFSNILKNIPAELEENYRLPGYISLESERLNYGVPTVYNVDINWSIVKNSDGSTGDLRGLDTTNNQIIYLKDENNVTFQADFVFDGNVVYSERISRTIPAKSIEGQIAYAEEYIKSFVPSIISGETYFPTTVPLYDLTISWIPDIESGKVVIGDNVSVNDVLYKSISVGDKAGYMEWAKVYATVERNGDETFGSTGMEFDVQLAGNSTEISTDKISDVNLYNALVAIFDTKYGNEDGILTEEEIYDTEVMKKLNYTIDLSNKGIKNISGIKYLKYYRVIDLSDNDLSGENAGLGDLASLNYLEQISLSNCGISYIPDSVFASKHLIEGIDLSYNKLKDVNFLTLKDSKTSTEMAYTELKELFLQGNYISDISNLSFVDDRGEIVSRIPNVSILTLSRDRNYYEYKTSALGNKILKDESEYEYDINTSMDITPIGYMEKLTVLWLANNNITDISPLANCELLTTLDLSGNSITATVSEDGLAPLYKLQSLVCLLLDDNNLETVKSLRRLIYLEILSLSNNDIGNVSGILDSLSELVYLDLDGNALSSFDASSFSKLKQLYLEDNELLQVMNLNMAPNITELRLNHNTVDRTTINSIAALTQLKYLSLSGNEVVDLDFLTNLTALTHLELANCSIRQEREFLSTNASTGETKTEYVDNMEYLSNLTNLIILDLSDNAGVSDISQLSALTKLGVFYINNVQLDSAASVRSMTKLQYLSMQNSGLSDLSFLSTLNLLEYLNLAGHNAAAFDFRYVKSYDNLVGLFLDSSCNTEVLNLNTFTNKVNLKFMSLSNMAVNSIDNLPDIDNIVYLGLRNTGISDFNGSYSETDGYLYPITRFTTLKYLDVAENPELFTKKNLEMLYDFVGKPEQAVSIVLYRDDVPEGYVPGVMDPDIEAKKISKDIDFGGGSVDISSAMETGYQLQDVLNGYDIEWVLEENELYYVEDGKLYFSSTEAIDTTVRLELMLDILDLYYRPENETTSPETSVSFTASIQTVTEKQFVEKVWVRRDETTSTENTLTGWILDESKTETGYSAYGDWSSWSTTKVTETDLRDVETKTESGYSAYGNWSGWSTTKVNETDLRDVETKQETSTYTENVYYSACASSYTSLVDALKSIGVDSSYANRGKIASVNGISNYTGTATQNTTLLKALKAGTLIKSVETKTKTTTYYRYRDRTTTSTTYYRYRTRTVIPTIYHFYKDIYEDVYEDVISGMTLVVE